jgi:hypothetical protein
MPARTAASMQYAPALALPRSLVQCKMCPIRLRAAAHLQATGGTQRWPVSFFLSFLSLALLSLAWKTAAGSRCYRPRGEGPGTSDTRAKHGIESLHRSATNV